MAINLHLTIKNMKNFCYPTCTLFAAIFALSLFTSCINQISDDSESDEPVMVHVSFSGFNLSYDEDDAATRSVVSASNADVNRIALSVFDSNNALVYSTTRNSSIDTEDFDQISCSLVPGNYTFVAVAHKATADGDEAAVITSLTEATINTAKLSKTFAVVNSSVTVDAEETNNVTLAFGKRISSQFQLLMTDDTPAEVAVCEIILNPSAATTTAYKLNPATGKALNTHQYKLVVNLSELGYNNLKGKTIGVHCLVTEEEQNMDVTINMKNSSDAIVKTLTLHDVPMAPHRVTQAKGNFFHTSAGTSFTFDTEDDQLHLINF